MGLKKRVVYWQLGRLVKSRKRTKRFVNLNHAKNVGIIWNENDRAAYEMLKKYLNENKIPSKDICYSTSQREITFSPKDFSFFGKPKNPAIDEFINERFDLLLDISLADSWAVQIVRALSHASFKAGWSLATPNYFDFSVDVSQRRDAYFLAEQLIHYLNEIK